VALYIRIREYNRDHRRAQRAREDLSADYADFRRFLSFIPIREYLRNLWTDSLPQPGRTTTGFEQPGLF
jgi:hypothetical protein